ncbi:MAG TPA: proteasome subunit alpha [Actinomycetota bacterium]|nr:proteasome subunit alpha [Actinomycetota bacterium]
MGLPFYVSPEQFMKDKSDYARKGISRGKSVIALDYAGGILFVAENPSSTLHKISEIYDRIAFAGVGKFNEFETLRMHGVRQADVRGYSYSRADVSARALANSYSQVLGQIFTAELKPFEVEILVAQVGTEGRPNELFHILYDGSVADEENFVAMGGQAEALLDYLRQNFQPAADLEGALSLGVRALVGIEQRQIPPSNLEVAALDRARERRKFRRLGDAEVARLLGDPAVPAATAPDADTSEHRSSP